MIRIPTGIGRKALILVLVAYGIGAVYLLAQSPTPISIGSKLPSVVDPTPTPTPVPHMLLFGMTPWVFGDLMKAWVMEISGVIDLGVAKVGVLGLAIIAVWQNLKQRVALQEVKDRQDRQGERVDKIALAVPAVSGKVQEVKVMNDPDKKEEAIPVTETPLANGQIQPEPPAST